MGHLRKHQHLVLPFLHTKPQSKDWGFVFTYPKKDLKSGASSTGSGQNTVHLLYLIAHGQRKMHLFL